MGALGGGTVSYERGSPVVPCHVKPISFGNHAQRAIRSEAYLGGAHLGAERCPLIIPSSVFLCLILFRFTNFVGPGFSPLTELYRTPSGCADGIIPHTQRVCGRNYTAHPACRLEKSRFIRVRQRWLRGTSRREMHLPSLESNGRSPRLFSAASVRSPVRSPLPRRVEQ